MKTVSTANAIESIRYPISAGTYSAMYRPHNAPATETAMSCLFNSPPLPVTPT